MLESPVVNSSRPPMVCPSLIYWPCRSISSGSEDFIWWSAQLLSGCHIPRWHVVTGPSGHACCQKQTDPLHSEGQGQSWDRPAQTRPSKLSQTPREASEGPDVRGLRTRCAHHRVGNALPSMHWGDRSLLGVACFGKVF